jgi:hypothetical protein
MNDNNLVVETADVKPCPHGFVFISKCHMCSENCHIPSNYKVGSKGYISCNKEGFSKLHRYIFYKNNNEGLDADEWRNKHKGKVIMHSCDNPSCINPNHLKIGTQIDNIKDRVKKGRSAYYESNGNAKLTEKDVEFIRYYHGKRTVRELSEFFDVDRTTIQRIQHNKNWMPLPKPPK